MVRLGALRLRGQQSPRVTQGAFGKDGGSGDTRNCRGSWTLSDNHLDLNFSSHKMGSIRCPCLIGLGAVFP